MNTLTSPSRALVLGGGGSTGNAWLIGVIAGLYNSGLDVTGADLIVGTSAGSTAAAQITGAIPTDLYRDILAAVLPPRPPGAPAARGLVDDHLTRMRRLIADSADAADYRRRVAAAALRRAAESDHSAQWRTTVASRLPSHDWPDQPVLITAVDAATAEGVVFDSSSGVDLVDAVAASCSSGAAYRVGERQFIDGGYRTNAENADLASGYSRVLILSPFGGQSFAPLEWGTHLATQIDGLRANSNRVEVVAPDTESRQLFGANSMDLAMRAPAARAGYDRAVTLTEKLAQFWI